MAARYYPLTGAGLNERPGDDDLMTMPMIPFSTKSYPMDMAIDPKLTAEPSEDQSQSQWSATTISHPSPHHSYDTPRLQNQMIPHLSPYSSGFYGSCDSSFSPHSSPCYSYSGSHSGSPSIGSESYIPLGPDTPQDTRVPSSSLYETDQFGYCYLAPREVQHGSGIGVNGIDPALDSPFIEATSMGNDDLASTMPHDFSLFIPSSLDGYTACPVQEKYGAPDTRPMIAQRTGNLQREIPSSGEPSATGDEQHLGVQSEVRLEASNKRSPTFAPRGPDHVRLLPGVSGSFPTTCRKRKSSPCATSAPSSTSDRRYCQNCKVNFQTPKMLEDHIKAKHARPFICVFHFAGCPARFEAKNEWKRHVSTKHVSSKYWLCLEGNCAQSRGSPTHRRTAMLPALGSIFNRKDLYTSHVRRMHPDAIREDLRNGHRQSPGGGDRLKRMQEGALRKRLDFLPDRMACPVQGCIVKFQGSNAWNERMEHVAQKHFDHTSPEYQADVGFGGPNDTGLTTWASRSDVQIIKKTSEGWRLCEPLKGENDCKRRQIETCDVDLE